MKKNPYQRVIIILFCTFIIGTGIMTILNSGQAIMKVACTEAIKGYKEQGIKGLEDGFIKGLETSINENIVGRTSYINLYGLSAKWLNKHYIQEEGSNSVVKDSRGHLEFITRPVDMKPYVEEIVGLKPVFEEIGSKVLYIQTPVKVIEDYVKMPQGITDYSNSNSDQLLQELEEGGIATLDLRQNIKRSSLNLDEVFYKTDHHWTTETAFWAVGETKDYLNREMDFYLDPHNFFTDSHNYKKIQYKNSFLGSQGRRVGKYYAGVDDYTLMLPTFDTEYSVKINKHDIISETEGNFEETLVKYYLLRPKDIFINRYAAYFGADFAEVIINNKYSESPLKVLIFKDSYGLPFSAFFSTMVAETRLLDTRYYTGNVEQYIKDYQPDLVLYVFKSINTQT